MNQNTKQRIVGTIVLLALALIFLPLIFDGQGSYQPQIASRIPDTPVVPLLNEPLPTRPVILGDEADATAVEPEESATDNAEPVATPVEVVETAPADDSTAPNSAEVVDSEPSFTRGVPELADNGLPQGWAVRLGSFSDVSNADALVERLLAGGYRAYKRTISSNQGALTAVYVGPWVDRSTVDEYQRQLQEEFQLAGIVVAFETEQL